MQLKVSGPIFLVLTWIILSTLIRKLQIYGVNHKTFKLMRRCLINLFLFGGKKIPELMRGLGKGMKEFKDASKGDENSSTPDQVEK